MWHISRHAHTLTQFPLPPWATATVLYFGVIVPINVEKPVSVLVRSGWLLEVEWDHPLGRTGMIMQYIIAAYNMDKPELPPVESIYNNSITSGMEEREN